MGDGTAVIDSDLTTNWNYNPSIVSDFRGGGYYYDAPGSSFYNNLFAFFGGLDIDYQAAIDAYYANQ